MERIYQKIGRIREYTIQVRSMEAECLKRFNTDPIYRAALLHFLYLLTDSCIALAELIIKHKNLRIPQSYHESFEILGENKILDPAFAFSFAKMAGFRNFLAHDYEKIDPLLICEQIIPKLADIDQFIEQIAQALK
jgi:uncharacterized protein YutE (UPF0331/DUF86 family)